MLTPHVKLNDFGSKLPGRNRGLPGNGFGMAFLASVFALVLITPDTGIAEEAGAKDIELIPAMLNLGLQLTFDRHVRYFLAQNTASTSQTVPDSNSRKRERFGEKGVEKRCFFPAQ